MDHFLFNTPRLLVGTKSDLRSDGKRISELNANGQQLITIEQVKKKNK
jgi:GTPase SAR1 family protein